jgi:hypothetical protein
MSTSFFEMEKSNFGGKEIDSFYEKVNFKAAANKTLSAINDTCF